MRFFSRLNCTAGLLVLLVPLVSQAQDFPSYGDVRAAPEPRTVPANYSLSQSPKAAYQAFYSSYVSGNNYSTPGANSVYSSVYTPGFNSMAIGRNGTVNSYYTPGHPSFRNDRGPTYFRPAFHSSYQAPGSLHYYVGTYAPSYRNYDNRR